MIELLPKTVASKRKAVRPNEHLDLRVRSFRPT